MKLHYITIQPTVREMRTELRAMEESFLENSLCQPLAEYEKQLYTYMKAGNWDKAHMVYNEITDPSKQWNPAVLPWAGRLEALIAAEAHRLETMDPQTKAKAIYKCIKEMRQEYWLAWLEDFFCEKIEWALRHCMQQPADREEHLYCVALPEFSFADSGNVISKTYGARSGSRAFYKPVVTKFLHGTLPKDVPRTNSGMKTLKMLTNQSGGYACMQVIIFAGTIIGRNKEQQSDGKSPYYNMAPVFTRGRCIGVWEKQEISSIDGKSTMVKHRHVMWSELQAQGTEGYTASVFSRQELQAMGLQELNPIFEIPVFQRRLPLRFTLCICRDYIEPRIIGCQPAEVYVLISYGMPIENHIQEVGNAVEAFLYCDGMYKGHVSIHLGDPVFWPGKPERSCTWWNINQDALSDNSYRKNYVRPGIYIEPNVLELNPKRLQL